ncbi:hypothetical protein [Pseudohoeflea coraliihabitans]|uniref:Uncharacterized protein n=1 Tax=Pseudohoeflea coraliihabitans TaxID=2860393 RepID=A0ABS6WVR7_9HYPH|nr:hypothetical protein [Pseudohoeflea sp. DP4N28-3]MBW3099194.1 hypothetical protein [Pseudohoeflea sp. DP4N28-3]
MGIFDSVGDMIRGVYDPAPSNNNSNSTDEAFKTLISMLYMGPESFLKDGSPSMDDEGDRLPHLLNDMRQAQKQGVTGFSDAMIANLGLDRPAYGYDPQSPLPRSGMAGGTPGGSGQPRPQIDLIRENAPVYENPPAVQPTEPEPEPAPNPPRQYNYGRSNGGGALDNAGAPGFGTFW